MKELILYLPIIIPGRDISTKVVINKLSHYGIIIKTTFHGKDLPVYCWLFLANYRLYFKLGESIIKL